MEQQGLCYGRRPGDQLSRLWFSSTAVHGVKARDLREGFSRQEQLKNRAVRALRPTEGRGETKRG